MGNWCCFKTKPEVVVIESPCPCVSCSCYDENIRCQCFDILYLKKNYKYGVAEYNAFS